MRFGLTTEVGRHSPSARIPASASQNLGELLHVRTGDQLLAIVVLLLQTVHQLGAQNVDLAVQNAAPIGDLGLLFGELADQSSSALRP